MIASGDRHAGSMASGSWNGGCRHRSTSFVIGEGPTGAVVGVPVDHDLVRLAAMGMATVEAAHDLGNLLQVVACAVRIIDRSLGETSEMRPVVDGALAAVDRAMALGRRTLHAARPRANQKEAICFELLLEELGTLIALAVGPQIELELRLGDSIPAIECNRDDLENAILNLVSNARDAMNGVGRLVLSVDRYDSDVSTVATGEGVVLRVADNGCGMSKEVAEQVFKPFFTTKSAGKGTGLGLAMVAGLVQRQGGAITVESVLGEGTSIALRLPASEG